MSQQTKIRNKVILEQLGKLIELSKLESNIKNIADSELGSSYYQLQPFSNYASSIEYTEFEHDPPGLFGKKDYWFDAMQQYLALEQQLTENGEQYTGIVNLSVRNNVLQPILDLIMRIRC